MLEKYFEYKKHKTDFKTEVIAGTTTFLTMAYIMFLNPFILSGEFAGPEKGFFDFGAVYTATILATALACFIMAFYGKTWPIGLAPGMGINAFVAFGVCAGMGYTPQQALGAVLVAGVLFLIISLTPIRAWLINSIPKSLKLGIGAGIGLFLAIIGLQIMEVVVDNPVTLVQLGNLSDPLVLLGCATFIAIIVLEKMNVKGNIIIGILFFSVVAWATGLAKFNGLASAPPPMTYLFEFDLSAAMTAGMSTVIFTLLFIDFFDTAVSKKSINNKVNITVDIPAVIAADKSNSKRYVIGGGALAKPLNLARPVAQATTLKNKIPIMIFPFTFIFSSTIIAIKVAHPRRTNGSLKFPSCTSVTGLSTTTSIICNPIIARNNPIPAPIPSFKLFGIELINQALIGVSDIIKNNTPATKTAPRACCGV